MERPEQNDDTYYPFSIKENMKWYIVDLEAYCDSLEANLKTLSDNNIKVEEDNKGLLCKVDTLTSSLEAAKTRIDYWCTQCTEERVKTKLLKQDIERRKRETAI